VVWSPGQELAVKRPPAHTRGMSPEKNMNLSQGVPGGVEKLDFRERGKSCQRGHRKGCGGNCGRKVTEEIPPGDAKLQKSH